MESVGIRELKDHLSHYLRAVRQRESVVVTVDRELWEAARQAGLTAWPEE